MRQSKKDEIRALARDAIASTRIPGSGMPNAPRSLVDVVTDHSKKLYGSGGMTNPLLTMTDRVELEGRLDKAEAALQQMTRNHLRLVEETKRILTLLMEHDERVPLRDLRTTPSKVRYITKLDAFRGKTNAGEKVVQFRHEDSPVVEYLIPGEGVPE